ncbi:hypothetical protein KFL_009810020 [Klebsormidium nitens]|uniref:Uncharacterized protein n=1 Tax=Klebsormidium nitens TaxID=105231 RepID=A0A1Y1IUH4_KLENI|nr:hypothetical protein KFL_009810020 [Klebsormidium nitens]|eukprot:GAQ92327.1 hypothetical protein KFL_009810020 [Klebsormidium nitens]
MAEQERNGKEIVPVHTAKDGEGGDGKALVVGGSIGQIRVGPRMPGDTVSFEEKLRKITEEVPAKVSNVSGSSAGAGSGDFHQYRAMRRWEQDRLARMEEDFKKKVAEAEFEKRRLERLAAAEERTSKKRAKRQKLKDKKKSRRNGAGDGTTQGGQDEGQSDDGSEENEHVERVQELQKQLD